jgi:hypothetical protein
MSSAGILFVIMVRAAPRVRKIAGLVSQGEEVLEVVTVAAEPLFLQLYPETF